MFITSFWFSRFSSLFVKLKIIFVSQDYVQLHAVVKVY